MVSARHVDRAVQTDPELHQAHDSLTSSKTEHHCSILSPVAETEKVAEFELSSESRSRESTDFDSTCSHVEEPFDRSGTPSPEPTISTTTRVYKQAVASLGRTNNITNGVTSRVVSLPETISLYSAKGVLKSTPRVVSTPLPATDSATLLPGIPNGSDDETLPFISNGDRPSRARVQSQVSDMPHTPSPPSSPESVVIIGNKNHLADNFLRGDRAGDSGPRKPEPDSEGWVSWASSPPRPIPALHGPLSLPYARCPSGAEGTIIEEPENLPRMIWGLEGEDIQSSRSRANVAQHPVAVKSPLGGGSRSNKANVPPRLQKGTPVTSSDLASQFLGLNLHDANVSGASPLEYRSMRQEELVGYPLRGQEPIDLTDLLRKELELTQSELATNPALGNPQSLRAHTLMDLGETDWPNKVPTSHIIKDSRLYGSNPTNQSLAARSRVQNGVTDALDEYSSVSQYSPALSQFAMHASERLTPRRQSALEIAQQYRQQQLQQRQQQNVLPTPPNSSSPIWSSSFTPYPSSTFSPELFSSVSGLSKLSPVIVSSRPAGMLSDVSQQLLRGPASAFPHQPQPSDVDLAALASAAQMDNLQELYATSPSLYTLADTVEAYVRNHARQSSNDAALQNLLTRSPAMPRPPPNTPLTVASRGRLTQNKQAPTPAMAAPPSPPSPQQNRTRTLSSHQTRSIPISRLIQRRLSAVPEEDSLSQLDNVQLGSADSGFLRSRTRTHSMDPSLPADAPVSQLSYLLSPPLPEQHIQMSDPRRDAFSTGLAPGNNRAATELVAGRDVVHVKLPSVSTRGTAANIRSDNRTHQVLGLRDNVSDTSANSGSVRGRGQKRGGGRTRGRGGRSVVASAVNKPERVDGGLMVKS
ncbi:hypothetical protein DAEQUDRAFT_810253 [Daedalea quercina L-15889]|uniref:Uncharacterized protein n=1 Tax=Daedalea quercina L-15889 TaxID=1314783 RepID=A0A165RNY5_9APHY|nr:hypothetical protein DAEQUDRAFT_810253 [Daedalea quercina L-15889]